MSNERLDWHLDNWASWMHGRAVRLWYPSKASGRMGVSHSTDFDTMVETADARCAKAVDAIVDGLPRHQIIAIHHIKLGAVWRLRVDLRASYEQAIDTIRKGLTARGIL